MRIECNGVPDQKQSTMDVLITLPDGRVNVRKKTSCRYVISFVFVRFLFFVFFKLEIQWALSFYVIVTTIKIFYYHWHFQKLFQFEVHDKVWAAKLQIMNELKVI